MIRTADGYAVTPSTSAPSAPSRRVRRSPRARPSAQRRRAGRPRIPRRVTHLGVRTASGTERLPRPDSSLPPRDPGGDSGAPAPAPDPAPVPADPFSRRAPAPPPAADPPPVADPSGGDVPARRRRPTHPSPTHPRRTARAPGPRLPWKPHGRRGLAHAARRVSAPGSPGRRGARPVECQQHGPLRAPPPSGCRHTPRDTIAGRTAARAPPAALPYAADVVAGPTRPQPAGMPTAAPSPARTRGAAGSGHSCPGPPTYAGGAGYAWRSNAATCPTRAALRRRTARRARSRQRRASKAAGAARPHRARSPRARPRATGLAALWSRRRPRPIIAPGCAST